MRILILGGDGMLGHTFFRQFRSDAPTQDVRVTLRQDLEAYAPFRLFSSSNAFAGMDVRSTDRLAEVFAEFHPEVVINAVGIVKQRSAAKESLPCLELNALLPHRVAVLCKGVGARMVQLSTDCIFSGHKGNYQEGDPSDAEDLYGKTKFLGEVYEDHCLTLRTSSVGHELGSSKGLLAWFLAQKGPVKGFKRAIYTGLTSPELARVVMDLILNHPEASGLYQLAGDPITKFDLLQLFNTRFQRGIEIVPDETFLCDRSLDSSRFRRQFGYVPPPWTTMVEDLPNIRTYIED